MNANPEVVICGAGAAGLALAIELARRGIGFRLLEQRDTPFQGSRGKGIQPRSQEIFEDMGILDQLFAAGGPYPVSRTYHADGSTTDNEPKVPGPATPGEPYGTPLMVPQFLTEDVLRKRLAELGARVEFSHALSGFEQDADGVSLRIDTPSGEQRLRTRYLIGADGGRSFVRQSLNIDFPGRALQVRAVVADIPLDGLTRDAWHRFNEDDMQRQIALCPLLGTSLFQLQAPVPLDGDVDISLEGLNSLIQQRTGRGDVIAQSVSWVSLYQMSARLAERYRRGNVLLVGDAAHIHPPTGGQGLNTSVQDAYNLGWKLAAVLNGASAALLDSYEEERRPIARSMLELSMKLLANAKRGDNARGREVQQLDLQYQASSLSLQQSTPQRRIKPGDRAPDALLGGAGGQVKRLFELFRGTHWTLLGYEADRAAAPARAGLEVHVIGRHGDLADKDQEFADTFGLQPGEWLLVRPDGYVAAVVEAACIDALIAHFDAIHAGG